METSYDRNCKEIEEFFQESWMTEVYTPIEANMVFYKRAHELGLNIYSLTNYSADGFSYLEENYDFIRTANGRIVSSHCPGSTTPLRLKFQQG